MSIEGTSGGCPLRKFVGIALVSSTVLSAAYAYFNLGKRVSSGSNLQHDLPLEQRNYEQERFLHEYLLLHYGEEVVGKFTSTKDEYGNNSALDINGVEHNYGDFSEFDLTSGELVAPRFPTYALNFPCRVAQLASHFAPKGENTCALDVGCAVGRGTFELSPFFDSVEGLDYSYNFIDAANALKGGKSLSFTAPIEGDVRFTALAQLKPHVIPERVFFYQGDATNLDTSKQYDCITAANLIDRLPNPRAFLRSLSLITKPGGIVVITSPYTWLTEYTAEEEWLVSDQEPSTFTALKKEMEPHFELISQSHMPFLIRETSRKNQFSYAHATVWRRKAE